VNSVNIGFELIDEVSFLRSIILSGLRKGKWKMPIKGELKIISGFLFINQIDRFKLVLNLNVPGFPIKLGMTCYGVRNDMLGRLGNGL